VTLGGLRFYRYLNLSPRGATLESVYALPSTVGTILGECVTGGARPSFARSCERVLATLRLSSGSLLPLGVSVSYAHALNQAISTLNAVRSGAGAQLHAPGNAGARAKAAASLAAAHAAASAAVSRLDAGPASTANSSLASALTLAANAYTALARAAAHSDVRAYASAEVSLANATSAMAAALAQLGRLGYSVA
jgi:hypothetical protein